MVKLGLASLQTEKLEHWRHLVSQQKSLFGWPSWQNVSPTRHRDTGPASVTQRHIRSAVAARAQLVTQLSDADGVSIEEARLRISAWTQRPMEDVTATFEVLYQQRWLCISRIDFHPSAPHANRHWRSCKVPPEVMGSHIHSFEDNAKLGDEAFDPRENLPNARPLDIEPQSLREIFTMVGDCFNVSELTELPALEWNRSLF
ncbi:hypothetical protein [Rhizobium sp. RAF56]|uniref:hypothetical protein n=1 Tax=Rhizobium sp. RAF56 TaxID=3233062 RepID=UPI003F9C6AF3